MLVISHHSECCFSKALLSGPQWVFLLLVWPMIYGFNKHGGSRQRADPEVLHTVRVRLAKKEFQLRFLGNSQNKFSKAKQFIHSMIFAELYKTTLCTRNFSNAKYCVYRNSCMMNLEVDLECYCLLLAPELWYKKCKCLMYSGVYTQKCIFVNLISKYQKNSKTNKAVCADCFQDFCIQPGLFSPQFYILNAGCMMSGRSHSYKTGNYLLSKQQVGTESVIVILS